MSTRAVYTFTNGKEEYHVFKHHDGYPSGAAEFIEKAISLAWALPRFEPDEFAAAFVAANKTSDGGVRLLHSGNWSDVSSSDIEYHYEISCPSGALQVRAFAVDCDYTTGKWTVKQIFIGTLAKFKTFAESAALSVVRKERGLE